MNIDRSRAAKRIAASSCVQPLGMGLHDAGFALNRGYEPAYVCAIREKYLM